jgi:hypothetical protein
MTKKYVFPDGTYTYGKRSNSYMEGFYDEEKEKWIAVVGLIIEVQEEDGSWEKRHARLTAIDDDYLTARTTVDMNFVAFLQNVDYDLWDEDAKDFLVEED